MKIFTPKIGWGQDSHRFVTHEDIKGCVIAGVTFPDVPALDADSDGDVAYHAICNAISSITHVPILGEVAIRMCHQEGIKDSAAYLKAATETFCEDTTITHVALSIEGKQPRIQASIPQMRENIAKILKLDIAQVGITCTSGDGLTEFGKGLGLQCLAVVTTVC